MVDLKTLDAEVVVQVLRAMWEEGASKIFDEEELKLIDWQSFLDDQASVYNDFMSGTMGWRNVGFNFEDAFSGGGYSVKINVMDLSDEDGNPVDDETFDAFVEELEADINGSIKTESTVPSNYADYFTEM